MTYIAGFKEPGLKGIHFFIKGLKFPIAIAHYTPKEAYEISLLESNLRKGRMTSEEICQWCISHQINYKVLYPIRFRNVLRNPRKAVEYLNMKVRLKNYQESRLQETS